MSIILLQYSEKLKELRFEITNKSKELHELEYEQTDFWRKLVKEFNSNKAKYRKIEGLSGLLQALSVEQVGEQLVVRFDKNSNPTAKALSIIEDKTGLCYNASLSNSDNTYVFVLD